ncbi:MAG: acyl-CoA dehydrogenase family protein [Acidobacteria bacterium]|nr:acyl-CoA dehydrogenase family protein [Acidobacteriota bacterium]
MRIEPTPQQEAYRQTAADFAARSVRAGAGELDATGRFPAALVDEAAGLGLLGVTVPRDDGGGGRDTVAYALALEAVATASAAVAMILAVHNSLVADVVARFGSDDQRRAWLRRLASGRSLGASALAEPNAVAGAGADACGVAAVRDGEHYVLCGRTAWVANAGAAELFVVFATSEAGGERGRANTFLVPGDAPGLQRAAAPDALGARGLDCREVVFRDVRLGGDALLGAPGEGRRVRDWALDGVRVATGALAVGVGQAAFDEALAYASRTQADGASLGRQQSVRSTLADTATDLDAARLLVLRAAAARDQQERCTLEASMAKLAAAEAARQAAERTMQLQAAAGYERGSTAERLLRDARAADIYHGTSTVQRLTLAAELLGEASGLRE